MDETCEIAYGHLCNPIEIAGLNNGKIWKSREITSSWCLQHCFAYVDSGFVCILNNIV